MKQQCHFCANNIGAVDYKDVETLKHFLGVQAKIGSQKQTGTCAKHQRSLSQAVKRARFLALLPFVGE